MTNRSREAIEKMNVLSSFDTSEEKRKEYKECFYVILKDLDLLDNIKSKTLLSYSDRKKIAKEYEKWCMNNHVLVSDTTNMVTWLLCIKISKWLGNEFHDGQMVEGD